MPLYVYALVDLDQRGAAGGSAVAARARTRVIRFGRIGAIVGDAAAPAPTPTALRAHDRVIRSAARAWTAVLPVRFGTTLPDERALRRLIQDHRAPLTRALSNVRGRVQMTVRVFGAAAPVRDEAIAALGRTRGAGTRYLRIAAAVEARLKRLPEFDPVRAAVATFVRDERVEPHASPPLIASVFHLMDRDHARAYRRALLSATASTPLRLIVTGPFPPYAFAPDDL